MKTCFGDELTTELVVKHMKRLFRTKHQQEMGEDKDKKISRPPWKAHYGNDKSRRGFPQRHGGKRPFHNKAYTADLEVSSDSDDDDDRSDHDDDDTSDDDDDGCFAYLADKNDVQGP